jgi:hypothetical protein
LGQPLSEMGESRLMNFSSAMPHHWIDRTHTAPCEEEIGAAHPSL